MTLDQAQARSLVASQRSRERISPSREETWSRAEQFLAVAGALLIATRYQLTSQLLTLGDVLAIASLPLWFPVLRRVGARIWLFVGLLCIPAGLVLSWLHAVDHQVRL